MTRGPSDRPRPLWLSASVQPSHPRRPEARRPAHGIILSRHLPAVTALNHFIRETLAPSPAPGPPPPGRPPPEPSTTSAAELICCNAPHDSAVSGAYFLHVPQGAGGTLGLDGELQSRDHAQGGLELPVPTHSATVDSPGAVHTENRPRNGPRFAGADDVLTAPDDAQPRPVTRLGAASPPLITFQPGGIPCQGGQDTNAASRTQSPRRRPSRATRAATARRAGTRLAGLPAFGGPTSRVRGFLRARSE